jgi:hypothetical protein
MKDHVQKEVGVMRGENLTWIGSLHRRRRRSMSSSSEVTTAKLESMAVPSSAWWRSSGNREERREMLPYQFDFTGERRDSGFYTGGGILFHGNKLQPTSKQTLLTVLAVYPK